MVMTRAQRKSIGGGVGAPPGAAAVTASPTSKAGGKVCSKPAAWPPGTRFAVLVGETVWTGRDLPARWSLLGRSARCLLSRHCAQAREPTRVLPSLFARGASCAASRAFYAPHGGNQRTLTPSHA